jgi:hypothetical protein
VHSFSSQSEQYFSAIRVFVFSEQGSQIVSMVDLQVNILTLIILKKIKFIITIGSQEQQDKGKPLTEFIKEGEVNLKDGERYCLTDIAVTSDNKLLLCNYSDEKVYIYKDYKTYEDEISWTSQPCCITVVPCTDKAVITCN